MPVAPVVAWVISVNTVLAHKIGEEDGTLTVLPEKIVIFPVTFTLPHPPVRGIR